MEAASDNPEKRGRGRPKKFPDAVLRPRGIIEPKTRKGRQDRIYAGRALRLLKERFPDPNDERWLWFFDQKNNSPKWSLMNELGRQRDDESVHRAIDYVLWARPTVKDGIKHLRTVRMTGKPPRPATLEERVREVVKEYPPDPRITARAILGLLDPFPDDEVRQILDRLVFAYHQDDRET